MSLREAIEQKEILVVCGAGGVGKTSVSAALALEAAHDRKVVVLTIDPAKRLASALGLAGGLGHHESKVDLDGGGGKGALYAAMLDMKTAWEELVSRYAPSPEVVDSIRSNRLYQGLSEHFVGSQGYMAMERLADLYERSDYDLVVIDTPPTRHALDFLEAPKRMTDFVGGSLLRWFAKPYAVAGRFGARAFNVTASPLLKVADRVLGSQVLEDLSRFVMDFQTMYGGFKERASEVLRLLHHPHTGFVVVTTPEGPPLDEARYFLDRLSDERLPLAGTVANRVTPAAFAGADARATAEALGRADPGKIADAAGLDEPRAAGVLKDAREALDSLVEAARRDRDCLTELERRTRVPVTAVPLLTRDVHDLESLRELGGYLCGEA